MLRDFKNGIDFKIPQKEKKYYKFFILDEGKGWSKNCAFKDMLFQQSENATGAAILFLAATI